MSVNAERWSMVNSSDWYSLRRMDRASFERALPRVIKVGGGRDVMGGGCICLLVNVFTCNPTHIPCQPLLSEAICSSAWTAGNNGYALLVDICSWPKIGLLAVAVLDLKGCLWVYLCECTLVYLLLAVLHGGHAHPECWWWDIWGRLFLRWSSTYDATHCSQLLYFRCAGMWCYYVQVKNNHYYVLNQDGGSSQKPRLK